MPIIVRRWLPAIFLIALVGSACSSSSTDTAGPTSSTSSTTEVEGPTTTGEPTIEGTLATTSTTIEASTSSTTTTEPPVETCLAPTDSQLVDVRPDDPDGGLNLRSGPGSDNEVVLPLPAGTEVVPSGECVELGDSGEWWAVAAATDDTVVGWVASSFLEPRETVECPAGLARLEGLDDLTLTQADMDGDGELDRVYIGTDASETTARMLVEFAAGGLAQGDLSVPVAAEVAFAFRPIGAAHDIVMYRDVFGGGASTSRFLFAEVDDCQVRDFGSVEAGASAGWGSLGFCLEDTPLGIRHWVFNAVGDTAEEGEANRTDEPFHYYEGEFVPGTGELEGRECIESASPASFRLAPPFIDTRGVGSVAPTVEELVDAVAAIIGADEDSSVRLVGEAVGVDAQGGFVTFDVIGLKDDSIGGYRAQLDFAIVLADDSPSAVRADRVVLTAFCSRGVTENGWCV